MAHYIKNKPQCRALVITAVGGGGKTTLLTYLYDLYRQAGLRVGFTTSCKLGWQPGFLSEVPAIKQAATRGGCLIGQMADAHHAEGLGESALAGLLPHFDVMLVEGDGAKRLPVKVPLFYEPVIYPYSDTSLVVAGLSALGQPLQSACFRLERACSLLGASPDTMIDPFILARLIQLGYLQNPALEEHMQDGKAMVLLNQCDSPARLQAFVTVRNLLGVPVLATHAQHKKTGGEWTWQHRRWMA